jgi:hypothetical protein
MLPITLFEAPTARLFTDIASALVPNVLVAPDTVLPKIRCCCDHLVFTGVNTYTLPGVVVAAPAVAADTLQEMANKPLATVMFCPNPTSFLAPVRVWLAVHVDPPTNGVEKITTAPDPPGRVTATERRVLATTTPNPKAFLEDGAGALATAAGSFKA